MVKFSCLVLLGFLLAGSLKAQDSSSLSTIKLKIDSVRNFIYTGPSADLLPPEFNKTALENEYYCDRAYLKGIKLQGQISVLRLRNNHTLVYETYYKPYDMARIQFHIGNYRMSCDTIYIKYRPLLKRKEDQIYVSPILSVSWIPPTPPEHLLLNKESLFDPNEQKTFYTLTDKPQFIFRRGK
ncbi:MAG: hypothetical protein H7Y86_02375 [Rhizobacter sp.]|nr:hypothetical protein [Ferruginibacter sp.]